MSKNAKKNMREEEVEEPEEEEEEEEEVEVDLSALPKNVFRRVKAVRTLHQEFEAIEAEYNKERLELEKKFEAQKQVYYAKRDPILVGDVDVPKVEGVEEEGTEETDEKGVPEFWLAVITSHPHIGEAITEEDVPALQALTNINVSYEEDFTAFTVSFHFKENDFFTNAVLTKKYTVAPSLLDEKNPNLSEINGCVINWKDGKNLCVTEIKKKQKAKNGRNKGQIRTVTRTVAKPSFFHLFDEHPEGDDEEEEPEEEEEEGEEGGKKKFSAEEDYEIGHTIRTILVPEAILWYTGETTADFDDDYMYGDDEEEEGDEDEEEEEEEDDEADDGKKKGKAAKMNFDAKKGFAASGAPAPNANGQQPECKQN